MSVWGPAPPQAGQPRTCRAASRIRKRASRLRTAALRLGTDNFLADQHHPLRFPPTPTTTRRRLVVVTEDHSRAGGTAADHEVFLQAVQQGGDAAVVHDMTSTG